MKKNKKIIISTVALFLVVAVIITAVLLLKKDSFGMTRTQRNAVVAKVGDETVTANELAIAYANYSSNIDTYNLYAQYYGTYNYYDLSTEEGKASLKQDMLDSLVEQRAYVALAKESGIELTKEEKAAAAQAGKDSYQEMIDSYTESYQSAGYANPSNYAMSAAGDYLTSYGIGTKSAFIARNTYAAEAELYAEKLTAMLEEKSGITEESGPALYEAYTSTAAEDYTAGTVALYDSYYMAGSIDCRALYIPEDQEFRFIRVISLENEARAEEMFAEIGNDAEKFETYCMSEENLDQLMPLVAADDYYAISAEDSVFTDEIYAAAKDMVPGDIQLVKVPVTLTNEDGSESTSMQCYIIRAVEGQTGVVPYEKIKDTLGASLIAAEKSEFVYSELNTFIADASKVSIDEAVFNAVKAD